MRKRLVLGCILLAFAACRAFANSDALTGVLSGKGDAGLGVAWRFEQSMYRGAGQKLSIDTSIRSASIHSLNR